MQCTLYDNINIPEDRRREIESQYDPKSIWYLRDIKGLRIVAEGLIYRQFADAISTGSKAYALTGKGTSLQEIILGVDFGGSGSGHSFTATGITRGFSSVIALGAEWINCQTQEIDPEQLGEMFCNFVQRIINQYGFINVVYADSAEQTLIAGLRASLRKKGLGWVRVENALKTSINDRINALCILIAQRRFFYIEGQCDSLVSAICTAVWNSKNKVKNERLDDGTSDIDSMDSFEYTFELQISRLIKYG